MGIFFFLSVFQKCMDYVEKWLNGHFSMILTFLFGYKVVVQLRGFVFEPTKGIIKRLLCMFWFAKDSCFKSKVFLFEKQLRYMAVKFCW